MNDRKHLTAREVERLITATRGSRTELRDRCLILLMFRHGLRVSEACALKLHQVDLESRVLHVARLKKGLSTTHPLRGDELRAIKAWLTERARLAPAGDTFFVSERRAPLNRRTAWVAIRRYGELAELSVEAHPHMLRHACGYALADQGADTRLIQDYRDRYANPYRAAELGYVDSVMPPEQTRPRVIRAFDMLRTKRLERPPRKHGNIPL